MGHPIMFDDSDPLLARLRRICLALPDAAEKISHGRPWQDGWIANAISVALGELL